MYPKKGRNVKGGKKVEGGRKVAGGHGQSISRLQSIIKEKRKEGQRRLWPINRLANLQKKEGSQKQFQ